MPGKQGGNATVHLAACVGANRSAAANDQQTLKAVM